MHGLAWGRGWEKLVLLPYSFFSFSVRSIGRKCHDCPDTYVWVWLGRCRFGVWLLIMLLCRWEAGRLEDHIGSYPMQMRQPGRPSKQWRKDLCILLTICKAKQKKIAETPVFCFIGSVNKHINFYDISLGLLKGKNSSPRTGPAAESIWSAGIRLRLCRFCVCLHLFSFSF